MWSFIVILVALSFAHGAPAADPKYLYQGDKEASPIIEHTDTANFEDDKEPKVVEFYSPYCG
jgi:hypothetical protein